MATATAGEWWSPRAPALVSLFCSLVFIARTAFTVNGDLHFTLFDDAMISMRYARNLAEGHGLIWNPGQFPVEGYTNLLWTLWMALLHLLPVSESKVSLLVMLSGALILMGSLLIVHKIARRLSPEAPLVPALAVWLTALYYPLIYWTLRGMEVGLITLTISSLILLALRLRDRCRTKDLLAVAALMALGILTRIDVVIPCVVITGYVVWHARADSRRFAVIVLVGAVAGTLAIHTAFRVYYYGSLFPNTYYLKVQGAPLGARIARGLLGLLVLDAVHLIVPLALSAVHLIGRDRTARDSDGAGLLVTIFVALCAYSVYVGGDAWDNFQFANRYVIPAMPGLLILSALGIEVLLRGHTHVHRSIIYGLALVFLFVGSVSAVAPVSLEGLSVTPTDEWLRLVRALLTLAPILVLPWLSSPPLIPGRRPDRRRSGVIAVLAVATLVAVNGQAASLWFSHNAAFVEDDAWATRYGHALREATAADAKIAVTWAGAIPYFSHRPSIDLLGKSDRVIARRQRQPTIAFYPGHDKWDYPYSIGELRPDVVAELWHASQRDVSGIESWGYVQVAPWVFVRADSTRVDRSAVKETACTILRRDPFLLGSAERLVPDLEDLTARYCR
ncbi:MAG: hypothetical protein PVSMB1_00940 [Gemmatimonadaceae bacterium]